MARTKGGDGRASACKRTGGLPHPPGLHIPLLGCGDSEVVVHAGAFVSPPRCGTGTALCLRSWVSLV
jgi:hypothetical protein